MTSIPTPRVIVRALLLAFAAVTLVPAGAAAQASAGETGRVHLGPLGVVPKIDWQARYDDNVFRTYDQRVSDLVSTLAGNTAIRTQLRRLGVTSNTSAQWVHYATLVSERGVNVESSAKIDFTFNRVIPYVSTSYDNSRERINMEIIHTRPRTQQTSLGFGGVLRLGGKTGLDVSAQRSSVSYERNAMADGVNLGEALNRVSNSVSLSLLQDVTPLTRLTIGAERERGSFGSSSFRSADVTRVTAGFLSDGRIKGTARAGMLLHKPHDPALPESRGAFVSVGTSINIADRVQIGLDAQRDLAPSYRPGIAYFDASSYGVSLSYAIRRSLRVSGTAGLHRSDYTDAPFAGFDNRLGLDTETRYGSGVSYLVGDSMSLDFSGVYAKSTSPLPLRRYEGLSLSAGVSHAF